MKKIIILGGGTSGLSIAYNIAKQNFKVEVYEALDEVGGMARSINHNGYLFDTGPHGYCSLNPKMISLFKEIMEDNYIEYDKDTEIKYKGKYFKYPLKPINVILNMNVFEAVNCLSSLLYNKIKHKFKKYRDRNSEEWIINRYGKPLYKAFFKDYTEKTWGVSAKQLSPRFTKHRIPVISFTDLILRGLLGIKKVFGKQHKYAETAVRIYYPKYGGIGAFAKQLKKKITKLGGKVFLNSKVTNIELKDNNIKSITVNNKKITGDIFISTIPITELVDILPKTDKEIIQASKNLKYRSILIFCLLINKDRVFKTLHYYYYDKYFGRLTELKNWSRWLYPKGKTSLIAEKTCNYNDKLWNTNEKKEFEKVIADIKKEKMIEDKDILDKFIIKLRFGYPIYLIGFEKNIGLIKQKLTKIKNLYYSGRQAEFKYMNMDNCIEEGLKLVEKITS